MTNMKKDIAEDVIMQGVANFLEKYARWIQPADRPKLFEAARQTILDDAPMNLNGCPEDLQERLRIVSLEAAYRKRVAGRMLNLKAVTPDSPKVITSPKSVILPYRQKNCTDGTKQSNSRTNARTDRRACAKGHRKSRAYWP